jgi:hypothetical protein
MTPRRIVELVAFLAALLLGALAFHAWLASHDDQLRLQAVLTSQKQLLDAADARERDRQASLKDTLAQIEALKRSAKTPAQILRELPQFLSLPQPITLSPPTTGNTAPPAHGETSAPSSKGQGIASPEPPSANSAKDLPTSPSAQIPAADLKPLFDYVQDCRACQAQLAAARQDTADNAQKIAALTRERDAAITAAKGGGFWRRLRRNALWFVVGAGAGAAALCSSGHCR